MFILRNRATKPTELTLNLPSSPITKKTVEMVRESIILAQYRNSVIDFTNLDTGMYQTRSGLKFDEAKTLQFR